MIVDILLANGAAIDSRDKKRRTPLGTVCGTPHTWIAKRLLDHGADIDAADANGWTPLMHACSVGKIETVQLLLQRGARINVKSKFKETALDIFGKRLRKGSSVFSPADQEVFQILKLKTKKSWL